MRIGPYEFAHADYDDFGDVAYVTKRRWGEAFESFAETPEGHALFAPPGSESEELIGIDFMFPKRQLEQEGEVAITLPGQKRLRVPEIEQLIADYEEFRTRANDDSKIITRESHMAHCAACDNYWDEWERGISLEKAVQRHWADPAGFAGLLQRACPFCQKPMDWDAVMVEGIGDTLPPSRQRRLAGTIRRLMRESAGRLEITRTIRERYGVIGFYVRSPDSDE